MPPPDTETSVLNFGPFALDLGNARLTRDGVAIDLPPKDLDVLAFLALRAGRLVSKDDLLDGVWQHRHVSESVLKTVVSRLRAVLGDDARAPRYIETAARRGYRFIAAPHTRAHAIAALPATTTTPEVALVGRDLASSWLQRQLDAIDAGRARVALVAGEAGIGKSSVIERFIASDAVAARALRTAVGQCVEHTGAVEPYLPILEALGSMCRAPADAELVTLMRQVAPTWLVQLPWHVTPDDRQQLQQEVAGATQDRMLRELGEFLDRATQSRPLLLVIEDLHWSDQATVQLIGYLARRRGPARTLLLGTLRPAELSVSDHPLKRLRQELRQQRLCVEIDLELFSEADAAAYLALRRPMAVWPETVVRALHRHTGGLPLFLAAVVDELGAVGDASDWLPLLDRVPRSIVGLIEQQGLRLPESTRQSLEAASVAGVEFVHTTLADALGTDPAALRATCDALVRGGGWLHEIGPVPLADGRVAVRYAFRHAVYRNVLYELAGAANRLQWHRALALALLRAHADDSASVAADVAVHFEKCHDLPNAVRHLAVAAHQALQRFAAAEAAAIARRALALLASLDSPPALHDTEVELEVVTGVAMAELKGVTSDESRHAFDRARAHLDGSRATAARVPALHGIWWSTLVRGEIDAARAMAERSVALGDGRADTQLQFAGHAALGITLVHVGEMAQAERHLLEALAHHGRHAAALPPTMFSFEPGLQLASYLAVSRWSQGRPSEARRLMDESLVRARAFGHALTWVFALHFDAMLHGLAGDHAAVRASTEEALQLIATHHLERAAGSYRWMLGRALVGLGEIERGFEMMTAGLALQQAHGLGYGLTRWYLAHGQACLDVGRHDAALAAAGDGLALAERSGEHAVAPELQLVRAAALRHEGRLEAAASACRDAAAQARQQHGLYAEIAASLDGWRLAAHTADAAAARAGLVDALGRWTDPLAPPAVHDARALLAAAAPR